ncbi:hypothetical protein B566_EDAN004824 [Ephemera danica]|nr:hypothetical protein B566_EDAN004824 [Ephemera danica]
MDAEITSLEREINELKSVLIVKEAKLLELKRAKQEQETPNLNVLTSEDIVRFSRQIILPQVGLAGQLKLKAARVLVVGVGGLGCPILLYLATAGVGNITIIDGDRVEVSNLHRQVLHSDETNELTKVESALKFLHRYKGYTKIESHFERLTPKNAGSLIANHDIIVDATDNVGTSALGLEGQITVYNAVAERNGELLRGPCYRCLFPTPPPAESAPSCSSAGVLGPIPGLIGLIQSIEVIKLIINWPGSQSLAGRMVILDANDLTLRTMKLRLASANCPACGTNPKEFQYYSNLCGDVSAPLQLLAIESRLSPREVLAKQEHLLLLDVRSPGEFGMCHIEGSLNFPINSLSDSLTTIQHLVQERANFAVSADEETTVNLLLYNLKIS